MSRESLEKIAKGGVVRGLNVNGARRLLYIGDSGVCDRHMPAVHNCPGWRIEWIFPHPPASLQLCLSQQEWIDCAGRFKFVRISDGLFRWT